MTSWVSSGSEPRDQILNEGLSPGHSLNGALKHHFQLYACPYEFDTEVVLDVGDQR